MCEQAGTGMSMMREAWQALGHPTPVYKNERAWKAFELFIPELDKEVDMASDLMKAMFGKTPPAPDKHPTSIRQVAGEVTREDGTKLALSRHQVEILRKCQEYKPLLEIMTITGRSDRTKFRHQVLNPLLDLGLIEMAIPDKPRSSKQKYRITEKGRQVLVGCEEGGK